MKKSLTVVLILVLAVTSLFAVEGETKITRDGTTLMTSDLGLTLRMPFSDKDAAKQFGGFYAIGITPASIKKIGLGFKAVFTMVGPKSMITGGGGIKARLQRTEMSAAALFTANMALAKSFEIYGGAGAQYVMFDLDDLSNFNQSWGAVFEAGGRGRVTNHFGVGVQADFYVSLSKIKKSFADVRAYISLEI